MPLVKASVQLSPGVGYYEVYQKYADSTAPYTFVGLYQVNGTGAQEIFFRVELPVDVKIKIVPICCDGCTGTPFEFVVEASEVTTTTAAPTTTLPTTTAAPTTTLPPTTTETTLPPPRTYDLCFSASAGGGSFPVFQVKAFNGVPSANIIIDRIFADGFPAGGPCATAEASIQMNGLAIYYGEQNGTQSIPREVTSGDWSVVNRVTVYNVEIQGVGSVSDGQVVNINGDIVTIRLAQCANEGTFPCGEQNNTPYNYSGYYASTEEMFNQSYPSNYVPIKFRRGFAQGNDAVRVYYKYTIQGMTREGFFDWTDNTTNTIQVFGVSTPIISPNELILYVDSITFVERI